MIKKIYTGKCPQEEEKISNYKIEYILINQRIGEMIKKCKK